MIFLSAAGRWSNGGDYGGMAADAAGVFHPVWADARTGTFQVWSARVSLAETSVVVTSSASSARNPTDITTSVEVLPDPSHFDYLTKELDLRLRLKNIGRDTIRGPIILTIRKFGSGLGADARELSPAVLRASNGRPGDGATFVFDATLGTERTLPPGGISGPVLLRFRVKDALRVPDMHFVVSAGPIPR